MVYDQSGKMVKSFSIGQGLQSIALEDLSNGIYHFQVISQNQSWNKKIVVR